MFVIMDLHNEAQRIRIMYLKVAMFDRSFVVGVRVWTEFCGWGKGLDGVYGWG